MRGKGGKKKQEKRSHGITPAYAGKSVSNGVQWDRYSDHPRLCGEKAIVSRNSEPGTGSPPPMRGKVCVKLKRVLSFGITPAYAGKRINVLISVAIIRDHPRLCGEKDTSWRM